MKFRTTISVAALMVALTSPAYAGFVKPQQAAPEAALPAPAAIAPAGNAVDSGMKSADSGNSTPAPAATAPVAPATAPAPATPPAPVNAPADASVSQPQPQAAAPVPPVAPAAPEIKQKTPAKPVAHRAARSWSGNPLVATDTATLRYQTDGGHFTQVTLAGITPTTDPASVAALAAFVRQSNGVTCTEVSPGSADVRCHTSAGHDLAFIAVLNGLAVPKGHDFDSAARAAQATHRGMYANR